MERFPRMVSEKRLRARRQAQDGPLCEAGRALAVFFHPDCVRPGRKDRIAGPSAPALDRIC
jgi:hypothetical protein